MTALVVIVLQLLLGVGATHPVVLHQETQPNGLVVLCDDGQPVKACASAITSVPRLSVVGQ